MIIGRVNPDFIAFDVADDETEMIAEYLVQAMNQWCLGTYGATLTEEW